MKKIYYILSFLIINILILNSVSALSFKTINIGGNDYNFYYQDSSSLNTITIAKNDLNTLNNILINNDILVNAKIINGDSLSNYTLNDFIDYYSINGVSIITLYKKYGLDIKQLLDKSIYTEEDTIKYSLILIKSVLKELNISENGDSINNLKNYFGNKLYLYMVRKESVGVGNMGFDANLLNNLEKVLQLGFENNINSLSEEIENNINSLSEETNYLSNLNNSITSLEELTNQYNISINKLNTDYGVVNNLINKEFTQNEINNLDNLKLINIAISDVFNTAKNTAKTGYTYILNSATRSNYISIINDKKNYILLKLNNKKSVLEKVINGELNTTDLTDSLILINGTYSLSSSKTVGINNDTIPLVLDDYQVVSESNSEIYNVIKNSNLTTNYDIIGLNILNNLENYTNYSGAINSISNNLGGVYNFGLILGKEIKDLFISLKDNTDTIKPINFIAYNFNSTLSELTNNFLNNFGKKIINNINIEKNTNLPFGIKINNEILFKNDLKDEGLNYFDNYDKSLYSNISSVVEEEGVDDLSFGYIPSPKIIKDNSNINIGIDYGNMQMYYLDNSYSNININLLKGYNYKISINSYNGTTKNLEVKYLYNGEQNNILLSGENSIVNEFGIIASIDNQKLINNQKNVLFVNDIIKK